MSIKSKLKALSKSSKKAQNKLVKLVSDRAKKKKILKQVETIQELDKERKKLTKKVKVASKDRAPKKKVNDRVKLKTSKKKLEKAEKDKNKSSKKSKKSPKKEVSKKKIKKPIATVVPEETVLVETTAELKNSSLVSTTFTARIANSKLMELKTEAEVQGFIKGEKRKTVLDRAAARMNSIKSQLEK